MHKWNGARARDAQHLPNSTTRMPSAGCTHRQPSVAGRVVGALPRLPLTTPPHSLPVCFAQVAFGRPYDRSQTPSSGWEGLRLPSAGHTCLQPLRVPHRWQAGSWPLLCGGPKPHSVAGALARPARTHREACRASGDRLGLPPGLQPPHLTPRRCSWRSAPFSTSWRLECPLPTLGLLQGRAMPPGWP